MILQGKFTVKAPIQEVWNTLIKPETIVSCLPGTEKIELLDENVYESVVKQKVGPMSVRFRVTVVLKDLDPPRYLKAVGKGEELSKMGTFSHETVVNLVELPYGEVEVSYNSNMSMEGRIATFGESIVEAKATEVGEQFTQALNRMLSGETVVTSESRTSTWQAFVILLTGLLGKIRRAISNWDEETDVIVVGGGTVGLPAAISAAEAGAKVLIIEKRHTCLDSAGAWCAGMMSFAGTDFQAEQGIKDGSALYYKDMLEHGEGGNIPEVVKAVIDKQLDTYYWLRELGLRVYGLIAFPGMSAPRAHIVEPVQMMKLLERTAESKGVKILFNTQGKRLILNDKRQVIGIKAERDGKPIYIKAKRGTILACGGFGQSHEWLERCQRGLSKVILNSAPGATGDGFFMALALGADLKGLSRITSFSSFHVKGKSALDKAVLHYCGAIYVNKEGKRFVNEALDYKIIGNILMEQTDGIGFQILDRKIYEKALGINLMLSPQAEALLVKEDTLEGLAETIGINAATLRDTVDRYNRYVEAGRDPEFGRKALSGSEGGGLLKIDRAPFYAFESTSHLSGTAGAGFVIDKDCRAINVFGEVIQRLFLGGEMAFGLHGYTPMSGVPTVGAIVQGLVAGRNAALEKPVRAMWARQYR